MASSKRSRRAEDDDQPYQGLIGQATSGSRIGPAPEKGAKRRPMATALFTFRYLVPAALILFGTGYAVLNWPEGSDAFSLFAGAGLSLLFLNVLYRMGVEGDFDRVKEEEARDYFTEHGVWPDEPTKPARRARGRGSSS